MELVTTALNHLCTRQEEELKKAEEEKAKCSHEIADALYTCRQEGADVISWENCSDLSWLDIWIVDVVTWFMELQGWITECVSLHNGQVSKLYFPSSVSKFWDKSSDTLSLSKHLLFLYVRKVWVPFHFRMLPSDMFKFWSKLSKPGIWKIMILTLN